MQKLRKLLKSKNKTLKRKVLKKEKKEPSIDYVALARVEIAEGNNFSNKNLTAGQAHVLSKEWYAKYREDVEAGKRKSVMPANPKSACCETCGLVTGTYAKGSKTVTICVSPLRPSGGQIKWLCSQCAAEVHGHPVEAPVRKHDMIKDLWGKPVATKKRTLPRKGITNAVSTGTTTGKRRITRIKKPR